MWRTHGRPVSSDKAKTKHRAHPEDKQEQEWTTGRHSIRDLWWWQKPPKQASLVTEMTTSMKSWVPAILDFDSHSDRSLQVRPRAAVTDWVCVTELSTNKEFMYISESKYALLWWRFEATASKQNRLSSNWETPCMQNPSGYVKVPEEELLLLGLVHHKSSPGMGSQEDVRMQDGGSEAVALRGRCVTPAHIVHQLWCGSSQDP